MVVYDGIEPTFVRGESASSIDVNMATSRIARRIGDWEGLLQESLSLHRFLVYEVQMGPGM